MSPDLHADVRGDGPALALVNGAWCNLHQWDPVVDRLAGHFTVLRHDVRGTGRSAPGPAEDDRFEVFAEDLLALVDRHGFESFSLWGMAWGSRVALVTAAVAPARVERLVLSDLGIGRADIAAQKQGHADAVAARAAAGVDEVPRPEGAFDHDDRDTALHALEATRRHGDLLPFVERVTAPTLIATGEFDPNLESSRRALTALDDGRLEVLPLTEHGSVLHRPDTVLDAVLPFLLGTDRD